MIDTEFNVPLWAKLLPLIGSLSGVVLISLLFKVFNNFLVELKLSSLGLSIYRFLNQAYYFDNFYTNFLVYPILNFGYITNKVLDKGVFEVVGPFGLTKLFITLSNRIDRLDTNSIPLYALYFISSGFGLIVFIQYFPDSSPFFMSEMAQYLILYLISILFISI